MPRSKDKGKRPKGPETGGVGRVGKRGHHRIAHKRKADINQLSNELLEMVLATTGEEYRGVVRAVCRQFRDVSDAYKRHKREGIQTYTPGTAMVQSLPMFEWARSQGCPVSATMVEEAIKLGRIDILEKIKGTEAFIRAIYHYYLHGPFEIAAKHNQFETVKWLYNLDPRPRWEDATVFAARSGNLEMLKWMYENGALMDRGVSEYAALSGNLEMIIWIHRTEGVPWSRQVAYWAGFRGHAHILKWAVSRHLCDINADTYKGAARCGLETLKWLYEREPFLEPTDWGITQVTAELNNLEMLQWAHAHGHLPDTHESCLHAAEYNRLEMLQWLYSIGCELHRGLVSTAAHNNNFEMLQWLYSNGCELRASVTREAATHNNLEMLKWARARGCPWTSLTYRAAQAHGREELLAWAVANGVPTDAFQGEVA